MGKESMVSEIVQAGYIITHAIFVAFDVVMKWQVTMKILVVGLEA